MDKEQQAAEVFAALAGSWIVVTNANGHEFGVKLIRQGDIYLTNRTANGVRHVEAKPLVEFYDQKYCLVNGFGPLGQFITRYYVSSLMDLRNGARREYGLLLFGAVEEWRLDRAALDQVLRFLEANA